MAVTDTGPFKYYGVLSGEWSITRASVRSARRRGDILGRLLVVWSTCLGSHGRLAARVLVAVLVVCGAIWPGLGRAQPAPAGAVLAAVQGEVVIQADGSARLGSVGMPIGAGDRVAIPRLGQATIRAFDGSELLLQAGTTVDVEEVGRGADGAVQLAVEQSRGLAVGRTAPGRSAEIRVSSPAAGAVALLRQGGMVVRVDEGTNNVTVGCEDRAARVFFPYEDRAVPCDQGMMRTLTTDGDVLDRAVDRGVPVVVAVFGGDQLGRGSGVSARVDHEEKEAVARAGPIGEPQPGEPREGAPPGPPAGILPPVPGTPIPAPPNDAFAAAIALAVPGSATADTRGATESNEPRPTCGGEVEKTVWYTLTSPAPRSVTITTEGSDYDTVLAVYTGASPSTLTQVACNDQDLNMAVEPGTSRVDLLLTPSQTYRVQVGGAFGASGTLVIVVR